MMSREANLPEDHSRTGPVQPARAAHRRRAAVQRHPCGITLREGGL